MNLLVIPPHYPHPAAEWVGAPNEHSALALRSVVQHLEVLTPRPYAPRLLAFNARWKAYGLIPGEHVRRGIRVHRPAYPALPGVFQAFWRTRAAFLFSRRLARALHRQIGFDAILSFDLAQSGGLAWRLGEDLSVPACGWATGSDIRSTADTPTGRSVRATLRKLSLVFYQSAELKALAADLLGTRVEGLAPGRHIVQARGVMEPEALPGAEVRRFVRSSLNVSEDQVLVLYLGRLVQGKGLFELVDGFADWTRGRKNIVLVMVGSIPGFDDTAALQDRTRSSASLNGRLQILPACEPRRIWDYFAAADIFAFPSFREGMPNSLLEAMSGGLPAIAFSIPSVQEITRFGKGLLEVPAHDFSRFGEALLRLAVDPALRRELGERGRAIAREHFSVHKSMQAVVNHIRRLTSVRP
jgi:glycosyltransferase involved in cell wall biosynthesis